MQFPSHHVSRSLTLARSATRHASGARHFSRVTATIQRRREDFLLKNYPNCEALQLKRKVREAASGENEPDRNYALAQALCVSKAAQAAQEIRMNVMLEKNYLLREKVGVMEGVLMKWRTEVAGDESLSEEARERQTVNQIQAQVERVYGIAGREAAAEERVRSLSDKLLELQEENMELRGRADHAVERSEELKALVDSVMQEEQVLKTKATQQVTRIRLELESRHADELRELREAYEEEKGALTDELAQISNAFHQVSTAAAAKPPVTPHGSTALQNTGSSTASLDVKAGADVDESSAAMVEKIASLQRSLEVERNRYKEAVHEASELEGLLAIQRQTLGAISPSPAKAPRSGTTTPGRSEVDGTGSNAKDRSDSDEPSQVEIEVDREDSALWPSLSTLLDELLRLLRALPRKHKDLGKDATLRTALAMAVRIKSICGSPRGRTAFNQGQESGSHPKPPTPMRGSPAAPASTGRSPSPARRRILSDDGSDTEGEVAVNSAVKSLVRRVHMLEDDLADVNVPERYMFMLRELRAKMLEMETIVYTEIDRSRSEHKRQVGTLELKLSGAETEVAELRKAQSDGVDSIRARYEEALRQAQDALDASHEAANEQVRRLEQLLSKCQAENEALHSETKHLRSETQHLRPMSEVLTLNLNLNLTLTLTLTLTLILTDRYWKCKKSSIVLPMSWKVAKSEFVACRRSTLWK